MYYSSQPLLTTCSFPYQRPALGMNFQPIPINPIHRYSDKWPHSSEYPNPPTTLSSHAALHAHPYIILNPDTHNLLTNTKLGPERQRFQRHPPHLSHTSFSLPTFSNQLLTSPCLEWNYATSVSAARDAHNRSSTRVVRTTAMFLCTKLWTSKPITRYHTVHSPFGSPGNQKIAKEKEFHRAVKSPACAL